ncbi:MAG: alanine--tRNA ligase [Bacteriovoracaceae bacterium]|jgi:alanyl-tRNA synthetase|nr:alanine--tRNA ligase [Bacteriovoracaceae bacterium]
MKSKQIREEFINFFMKRGHQHISSSPLIPIADPTLLFANAGMNQFKDFFTGIEKPKNATATTIQKCVRAGGKHNDLDNVGFTARHHTYFEMMGNFSFGDYFKKEAIAYHWELLTKVYKIPKDKLYITVHESDDEALNIWHKDQGVPLDRIFKKGDADNFWEMGEIGPCGPCSEFFYDWGEEHATPGFDLSKANDILEDEMRYVEIGNLVFMQYEQTKEGRIPLPSPSVDTGTGLERVAAVLQNKYWNYDTDIFEGIMNKLEEISGKKYSDPKYQSNFRVVADHIRSSVMLITDGAIPSNEGRGYVLRRIIRRAVRHLRELGIKEISFHKLVPTVFETLGAHYPENKANLSLAEKLLQIEERKFLETLDNGLKFLEEAISGLGKKKTLLGADAFKLYDTFGFPVDLTEIICTERGLNVDMEGFDSSMAKQRELSKRGGKAQYGDDTQKIFAKYKETFGNTIFLGYKTLENHSELLAIHDMGKMKALIFKESPFYGESGGQSGDAGEILDDEHVLAHIVDTQKPTEGLLVHYSEDADALEIGKSYILSVNHKRRSLVAKNHSATHLLQAALIKVLGSHIKQAGSYVNHEKLRFDFTHTQAMTKDEIKETEKLVNLEIQKSTPVNAEVMSKDDAMKKGALAFFGEKYGDEVRVIEMGDFSTEFCGGTHVSNTGDISQFNIISESALASGVRRIEGLTSETASNRLQKRSLILEQFEQYFNVKDQDVTDRFSALIADHKDRAKKIEALNEKIQASLSETLFDNPKKLGDKFTFKVATAPENSNIKQLSDLFSSKYPDGILLLFSSSGKKLSVLLRSPRSLKSINCGQILKSHLPLLDGRGGGRPDLAQGSGEKNKNYDQFITNIEKQISEEI